MWQKCGNSSKNSPFLIKVTSNRQQAVVNKNLFNYNGLYLSEGAQVG